MVSLVILEQMLTINELKNKLSFTQNIRRILESLKLIAAMNMKKYTMKYKHAQKLTVEVGIDELHKLVSNSVAIRTAHAFGSKLSTLNIVISAQSGLCGNFMIDLNRLITEKVLGAHVKVEDIVREHLRARRASKHGVSGLGRDEVSGSRGVDESGVSGADFDVNEINEKDVMDHLFRYDEIEGLDERDIFGLRHVQEWAEEDLDQALAKHKEDKWILIGNKIPDVLKCVKLHHHMIVDKEILPGLMTLSHVLTELEGQIEVINIVGWTLDGITPEIRRISMLDPEIDVGGDDMCEGDVKRECVYGDMCTCGDDGFQSANVKKCNAKGVIGIDYNNDEEYDLLIADQDRYNRFMMQSMMYMNARILASFAREDKIRFFTMDQAINNADEMTQQLKNDVNQTRQGLITNELIEIITGAEFA